MALGDIVDRILDGLQRRDVERFAAAMGQLGPAVQGSSPGEAADAARRLVGVLPALPYGIGSNLAPVVGALCDFGADPGDVLPVLVDRVCGVLAAAARFKEIASRAGLRIPPPSSGEEAFEPTVETLLAAAPRLGLERGEVAEVVEAWFAAEDWVQPVLYLSQRKDVRVAMPRRAELATAVASASEDNGTARWLDGLLKVLDDEQFLVLHRATGLGWRCTMSGIGDNFQLHTLLAARLIGGGLVPGQQPTAAEVAAAETGDLEPPGGINGNFNLVDAAGAWIWNEGRPADIPHHHGVRVVVLDPPAYARSWNAGRAYPLMVPTLTVDAALPPDEAAAWLGSVKPDTRGGGG